MHIAPPDNTTRSSSRETTNAHHDPTIRRFLPWLCLLSRYSESNAKPILDLISSVLTLSYFVFCIYIALFYTSLTFVVYIHMLLHLWIEVTDNTQYKCQGRRDWIKLCFMSYIYIYICSLVCCQHIYTEGTWWSLLRRRGRRLSQAKAQCAS